MTTRALWVTAAKAVAFAVSIALPIVLTRRLDPTQFGLYKQAFLVVGTATIVLPLGFAMSAFFFLPREPERKRLIVFNIVLVNALVGGIAALLLAVHPSVLADIFGGRELVAEAPLIGLVILLWIVSSSLEIIALAHEDTKAASAIIVTAQLSKTLLLVAAAIGWASVQALIAAAAVHGALQTIALFTYLRWRFGAFWRGFDWSMVRTQAAYAIPLGVGGVLYALQNDMHNYFVANQFGPTAFAFYAVASSHLPVVAILSDAVGSVLIPRVSALQAQDKRHEIIAVTARAMRKLAAVYFPLYAFLIVLGREVLALMFTPAYLASWPIMIVSLTLIPAAVWMSDPVLRAYSEQRFFLLRTKIAVFVLMWLVLWFGTADLGLIGVMAVVVAMAIGERAITAWRAGRVLGVTRRDAGLLADVGKLAIAALGSGVVAFIVRRAVRHENVIAILAICGVALALTYLGLVAALRVLTVGEWQRVTNRSLGTFSRR